MPSGADDHSYLRGATPHEPEDARRVERYERQPLAKVVTQFRFNPVQVIAERPVGEFQEVLRPTFPTFQESQEFQFALGPAGPLAQHSARKSYAFGHEEHSGRVTLSVDSIAVEAGPDYPGFAEFSAWTRLALEALENAYHPGAFTRIGFRYVNLLRAENLGDVGLGAAIRPSLLGVLADDSPLAAATTECGANFTVAYSDRSFGAVRTRLQAGRTAAGEPDQVFVLDIDSWTHHRSGVDEGLDALKELHRFGRGVFSWCITDSLHSVLGPVPK